MKQRVLVVEDDRRIADMVIKNLETAGYECHVSSDGGQALADFERVKPDLVVLDLGLPGIDGLQVTRKLRRDSDVAILMLTARTSESDKLLGLELGADDYVTKPFSLRELLARVHALLRRATPESAQSEVPEEIAFGNVHIDTKALRGKRGREQFELTPRELKVLALLWRERGNAVARDTILNEVWGIEYYGTTRTLDQLVVKLRQKIEDTAGQPRWLVTVHGHGYRLEPAKQ